MSPVASRQRRTLCWVIAAFVLLVLAVNPSPALASLGFVGNMAPSGGATNTIAPGDSFDVYIQVWKNGITEPAGQGANISCTLSRGTVGYFGGTWSNITNTPMTFFGQVDNNDQYKVTINPTVGLYEFTVFCTDATDNSTTYQGGGNSKIIVKTAAAASCSTSAQGDNNVFYNGFNHDTFSTTYRNPGGAVPMTQGTVTLKFRTCMNDLNQAPYLRVYDLKNASEILTPGNGAAALSFDSHSNVAGVGDVTMWSYTLTIPNSINIYYYTFRANDGSGQGFYRALDKNVWSGGKCNPGGQGMSESDQTTAYDNSFQISMYDPAFSVPSWMQKGIVYQIYPDRFRDGDVANDPAAGRFFYNEAGGTIFRSKTTTWNTAICDPRAASPCPGAYSNNFYGGDLKGITDKVNQGFFDNLGVSVIYLNPIFRSPSNHKYDTSDYLTIDPDFGTLTDFQNLATATANHNIKLILDGVFNHTSSDSTYFDRYFRYNSSGTLTSPGGVGTDDNSGACEDLSSSYRSWFYLPATGAAGRDGNPNSGALALCDPVVGSNTTYEAWYGYSSLPKLQANSTAVKNLIWNNGLSSVGPYWTDKGADGWRFDVGADVDQGLSSPTNTYWEGFRNAVRAVSSDTLTLGEEWDDSSKWLLGTEWDSVMNYRFRAAVMAWLFTGCTGTGCTGGTSFAENDSNNDSSSGSIAYLSPSQFNARLRTIQEDYPPMAFKAMMNLPGSHDTQRVRFMLYKINNDSDSAAVQRMKEWWLFAFTYAGAPTLYYGDEIGLSQDGVVSGGTYQDDPYNRVPYPWDDTPGDLTADTTNLLVFERKMASIRLSYPALQDGDVQHGILIDDANKLYGFARTNGSQTALIVLNRDSVTHNAALTGLNAAPYNLPDGTVLRDVIEGNNYTVSGGSVTVPVNSAWGVVLLEPGKIQTPSAPANVTVNSNGGQNLVQWSPSVTDTSTGRELATSYTVHRSQTPGFTPGAGNLIASVTASAFGTSNGKVQYTDPSPPPAPAESTNATNYYAICAINAGGTQSCSGTLAPTGSLACLNLAPANLMSPAKGTTVNKRTVKLDWDDSMCVARYTVVVRADSKKGKRADTGKQLTQSEFTTERLEQGKTYFWRVKTCAEDACRRSVWFTFKVE